MTQYQQLKNLFVVKKVKKKKAWVFDHSFFKLYILSYGCCWMNEK